MVLFNKNFTFAVLSVCLLSAFPFGYHMGVTNNMQPVVTKWMQKTDGREPGNSSLVLWSTMVALFPAGGMLGSLFSNSNISSQKILFYDGFLMIASQVLIDMCKEANSFIMLAVARFLVGVAAGISSVAGPLYLAEISGAHLRDLIITIHQFFISMSVFYAQIFGLPQVFGTEKDWIIGSIISTIPSLLGTLLMKCCPDSPRHLLIKENEDRAAMMNLAWFKGSADISPEFEQLMREREKIRRTPDATINNIWSFPLLVCFFVVISEQLCGINVFIYYSSDIFVRVGFPQNVASYATVSMGACTLLGLLIFMALVQIVGRRILFLISLGSLFSITILLVVSLILATSYASLQGSMKYMVFVSASLFGVMYGVGVGPLRWLIISETFSFTARPLVASLVFPANFLINAIIAETFLFFPDFIQFYMLIPFIFCDLFFFVFAYLRVPKEDSPRPALASA